MPVIDHPVHERTRIDDTFRYGCHSSRRGVNPPGSYLAKDGHAASSPDGLETVQKWKVTPHVMSRKCHNFRLWDVDAACQGCRYPKCYAYAAQWGYAPPENDPNDVHSSAPAAA